jgi:hypothetical protein
MASPYPIYDEEEETEEPAEPKAPRREVRLLLTPEAYRAVLIERARELGIDRPEVAVTHAITVWYRLTDHLVRGIPLLVPIPGDGIRELIIEHPLHRGEPLVPTDNPNAIWLRKFDENWWFGEPKRGDRN